MKKMSGFSESLVSSQFLFHRSRYCSLFPSFPSHSHQPLLIVQAKHTSQESKDLSQKSRSCVTESRTALKDPLRRILDPWEETERLGVQSRSKKLVFVVTSILSSTSILLFHFLPLHSHFLSGLLVMLFYLGNIEQDTQDLQICMNNIEKMFATDSFCYN